MAWRREVGTIKLGIVIAALIAGSALPALADDTKLTLTGSATFTTDYMFRSISNTNDLPAVQPEFDLGYGMFWAYMWGSNTVYGKHIEIDYGAGISPKWKDITFTFGGLYYSYPGANAQIGYFEAKGGATWAKGPWSIGVNDWWSPNFFQAFGQSNAIETDIGYTFSQKIWNFFTPSISGAVGFQSFDKVASDYTYWNVGMTFAFLNHWSADIRYYDTDYNQTQCFIEQGFDKHSCDARAVGTIKATF